jgi:hypothetical protein
MINCRCSSLPDVFCLDEGPKRFEKSLLQEDLQNWMRLYSCPKCGTLWAIDEWDKYEYPVVSRVKDRSEGSSDQRIEERKQLLLRSRGKTTDEMCIWSGCPEKRVKGLGHPVITRHKDI